MINFISLILFIGIAGYFTAVLDTFQIRHFKSILNDTLFSLFQKRKSGNNISPFQAVSTALAGTMGTGNIVGVATAIYLGGASAVFWMWVSAFLGMATKYSEIFLAVKYRQTDKSGNHYGGPMYYLEKTSKTKCLAYIFSFFCVLCSLGIGNMVQSNSVTSIISQTFNINAVFFSILLTVLCGLVIVKGVNKIAAFCEKLIPFFTVLYFAVSIYVLISNIAFLPSAFKNIFESAFSFKSAAFGIAGSKMALGLKYGVSRGIFSNEAGLGSAPIVHACADTNSPCKQGMWGVFEVFVDTIVTCTLTALVIIVTNATSSGLNGASLTTYAYSFSLGSLSKYFISFSLLVFAFSSIIAWSIYGKKALDYLTSGKKQGFHFIYNSVFLAFITLGGVININIVWQLADIMNVLMAAPNIIGLLHFRNEIIKDTCAYFKKTS